LSGEVVVLILVGIFGAIAAGLVVYGLLQSRREPKSQIKAATTPVAKTVTTPTKTQSKTPVSERFCEKCYAIIPGDLEFCSECGARQD
jgi:hypothetical protein